jgi:tetratricopeptide (TPR) repeat protein
MGMTPAQIAMLVCGILLFVVALVCVVKRRSATLSLSLFVVAIIMIGFPSIKSFKLMGAKVELNQSLAAVEKNPNDANATARVEHATLTLEALTTPNTATAGLAEQIARGNEVLGKTNQALKWATAALEKSPNSAKARELVDRVTVRKFTPTQQPEKPVSPEEQSKLAAAVSQLKQHSDLAPESRVTLSKAQLALGQRDEAAANPNHALKVKPNLKLNPNLKALVTPNP